MTKDVYWWLDEETLNQTMALDEMAERGEVPLPILPGHIRNSLISVFRDRRALFSEERPDLPVYHTGPGMKMGLEQPIYKIMVEGLTGPLLALQVGRQYSGHIKHYPGVISDTDFNILKPIN